MSNHTSDQHDFEDDAYEHSTHAGTSVRPASSKGYSFQFNPDGTIKAAFESEYGRLKQESIEPNEHYALQQDGSVIKTESGSRGTEITTYSDTNRDGLLEKIAHTWTPNTSTALNSTPAAINTSHDDWYEYGGNASAYHIEHADDGTVTVTHAQTMQVLDASVTAKRMLFSDHAVAFDDQGNAGQAYRLYKAAFDREADNDGLGYWIAQLDNGTVDLRGAAHEFMKSAEFQSLYGAQVASEKFIDLLYANVLNRSADTSGKNYWLTHLDQGTSREEVFINFSESAENQAEVAQLIGTNGITYTPYY